ncbi:MAG TPA: hypothetical protein VKT31_07010 [Solirubrobacteraceae bacterium]|nr:hypothetical protein [Solirubrobacteraceae bacterium]
MGAPDPETAVLEHLAGPVGTWEPGPASPGGIQSGLVRDGNPEQADMSSVRFVKHRRSERRHVYFVSFVGTHPRLGPLSFHYVYPVEPDPDGGWRVLGGAGGAGDGPKRSAPWVNLGGGGWPDRFFAGGHVDGAGHEVARVELRFANGVTLADDADAGVALFITDESVELPATAVLFDRDGAEVGRHTSP